MVTHILVKTITSTYDIYNKPKKDYLHLFSNKVHLIFNIMINIFSDLANFVSPGKSPFSKKVHLLLKAVINIVFDLS